MIFARRNQRLFLKNTLLNSFCNKREDTFKYEKAGTERLLKQHKKRKGDKGIEYKTYEKWLQQWMSHLKDNLPYIVGIPVMGYVGMNLYLVSSLIDLEFYDPSYRALMNKLRYSIVGFNVFNVFNFNNVDRSCWCIRMCFLQGKTRENYSTISFKLWNLTSLNINGVIRRICIFRPS